MIGTALEPAFFDRDAQAVARGLVGKSVAHRVDGAWLQARIVEVEAYYLSERGSHASLGYTSKRRALFMPAGTLYLYYARGGDSLNVSCAGEGNAVLIKGAIPEPALEADPPVLREMLRAMHARNPLPRGRSRPDHRLCAGQTLVCRALGIRVPDWNAKPLPQANLAFLDTGYLPRALIRARRLGIPEGRDEHLPYRFVDADFAHAATRNPVSRGAREGDDFHWVDPGSGRVRAKLTDSRPAGPEAPWVSGAVRRARTRTAFD